VIVNKIEGKFVNLHRHGGKQLSTPDLGRCASTSESANFNTTKHSDSPFCGLFHCVIVCALPSVEVAWWAVHFSCILPH